MSNPNDPTWFRAHATDCPDRSRFIGDHIGASIDALGRTHMLWTDMRRNLSVPSSAERGKAEDAEYARR